MHTAFAVAKFYNMAEYVNHNLIAFFLFQHLLRYHIFKMLLLGIEHDHMGNAVLHRSGFEGPADIFQSA